MLKKLSQKKPSKIFAEYRIRILQTPIRQDLKSSSFGQLGKNPPQISILVMPDLNIMSNWDLAK
jgi:hypothetical protein